MLPVTPEPACGVPLASTGGQSDAHGPLQVEVPFVSATKRYSDLPCPSVRFAPIGPEWACTVTSPAELGPVLEPVLLEPQATRAAKPTSTSNTSPVRRELLEIMPWSSPGELVHL